jgi:hypothetical protein
MGGDCKKKRRKKDYPPQPKYNYSESPRKILLVGVIQKGIISFFAPS